MYFGLRMWQCVTSGERPPYFISFAILASAMLWGTDFQMVKIVNPSIDSWIVAAALVGLVFVDRGAPSLLFPPTAAQLRRPYPGPLGGTGEQNPHAPEMRLYAIEEFGVQFLQPDGWNPETLAPLPEGGRFAVTFRGANACQFLSCWINDAPVEQASLEELERHAQSNIRNLGGRLNALGYLTIGGSVPAIWCDYSLYSLMVTRKERRICFLAGRREYVLAFSSTSLAFPEDVGIFDMVVDSFTLDTSKRFTLADMAHE